MEGNCPMPKQQHHCSASYARKSKESVTQPDYLVAKFKYNAEMTAIMPQGETLKPTGRW
jgi:hypothetical protein